MNGFKKLIDVWISDTPGVTYPTTNGAPDLSKGTAEVSRNITVMNMHARQSMNCSPAEASVVILWEWAEVSREGKGGGWPGRANVDALQAWLVSAAPGYYRIRFEKDKDGSLVVAGLLLDAPQPVAVALAAKEGPSNG